MRAGPAREREAAAACRMGLLWGSIMKREDGAEMVWMGGTDRSSPSAISHSSLQMEK